MNILTQADNTDKNQWTRDKRSIDFNEPLNTVENDFFGFPKIKWLHLTGEVDKSVRFRVKFSQHLTYQKSLKSVNF